MTPKQAPLVGALLVTFVLLLATVADATPRRKHTPAHGPVAKANAETANGAILHAWKCRIDYDYQHWELVPTDNSSYMLVSSADRKCADIGSYNMREGAKVQLWDCHPQSSPENQRFRPSSRGELVSVMNGKCVAAAGTNIGAFIEMETCDGSAAQRWDIPSGKDPSLIRNLGSGYCLDVGSFYTCQDEEIRSHRFCNHRLPTEERVDDLVSRMTLEEMYSQMGHQAPSIPQLAIPDYNWWTECLHGVLSGCGTNCPTSFPAPCATGSAFNMELVHEIARAISNEARALNNEGVCGLDFWAPNININRDPRWGRNMEVPGEDPYLTAQYVRNFMRGLQEGYDPHYPQVVGTCKHYAAYSLENWYTYTRFNFNAVVSDYDFAETFFPAFRSCVVEGRTRSIMCSYNAVNGVPACANEFLLQSVLRESWDFDGYVVSDCDAVETMFGYYHYTETPEESVALSLRAGTDLNCGSFYQEYLPTAMQKGLIKDSEVKRAMKRLFKQRFELGMWDPVEIQPYKQIPPSVVDSKEHSHLALRAAREAMVLLKNDRNLLPLSKNVRKVAVIGPNANATETMLGNYYGQRCHDGTYNCMTSPYLAIKEKVPTANVIYAQGCGIDGNDTSGFAAAVQAATGADVAILILGLSGRVESEGLDRVNISLPGMQDDLFKAVRKAGVPVVVVLMHGGAVAVEYIKDNADAIIDAFYPGENGGIAIADVLFGDYNPGGKLPVTVFKKEYVDMVPLTNMSMRAGGSNPGRTYRYYTGPAPLWEFGFGLSYTKFNTTWLDKPTPALIYTKESRADTELSFRVRVKNIGHITGDEVVMAFIRRESTELGPLKQLFGFKRVHLAPGESKEVFLGAGLSDTLAVVSPDGKSKILQAGLYQVEIGVGENKLTHPIEVVGPTTFVASLF